MHMLHCRKKAEIEILYTLPKADASMEPASMDDDDDLLECVDFQQQCRTDVVEKHPLIRYLAHKIGYFVDLYSDLL